MEKMMGQPLITVIIPIYNGETFIDKCLASVTSQTYPNLEIICVVNGSTDSSVLKINEWKEKDSRVRLIVSDIADLGNASNIALDASKGEYIAFVDVDDWVMPEYISSLMGGIQKGYKMCRSNCIMYDGRRNHKAYQNQYSRYVSIREATWLLPFRHTGLYARALFSELRYLEFSYYEDLSLWPILVARANGVYYIDEPLYYYNQTNVNSIMSIKDERHLVLDKVFDFILSHITEELDREVNLLVTCLFVQSFWTSNIQYVPRTKAGINYMKRIYQVINNKLVGYYYVVQQLNVPPSIKSEMIDFYKYGIKGFNI
ncbi:glycosyltransferase family 2 protein [Granulicatella sp. zg-84]|uniref:glycosyltransferase family 2 protein n=1 Tax=Granulicatella sp. zg-84 TaxID=2678503 RepID=UPI0013D80DE9|nr:glycosyltransferase family 2 protein [Granulicatella sp. zg-84]